MNLFAPVNDSTKLSERITTQITKAIAEGRYNPGDKLPSENQLADLFGVSRTVIREAMQILSGQGLVEVKRGLGAFVTATRFDNHMAKLEETINRQREELLELFQVRRILEEEVVVQAAQKATPEDIGRLTRIVEAAENAVNQSAIPYQDLNQLNAEFHSVLLEVTSNRTLKHIMNSLIDVLMESREITLQLPGRSAISVAGHRKILNAIREGDVERARQAMSEHLRNAEETIKQLKRPDAENESIS
jgi:GntR family transcriptional repressor for pyruvate dehydrogenase complex